MLLIISFPKKKPGQKAGQQSGTGLGLPIPVARERDGASLRRAAAYSQKSTCNDYQKHVNTFFIMIKDYTDDMSKGDRQTVGKMQ
jgi:hypothetical protein